MRAPGTRSPVRRSASERGEAVRPCSGRRPFWRSALPWTSSTGHHLNDEIARGRGGTCRRRDGDCEYACHIAGTVGSRCLDLPGQISSPATLFALDDHCLVCESLPLRWPDLEAVPDLPPCLTDVNGRKLPVRAPRLPRRSCRGRVRAIFPGPFATTTAPGGMAVIGHNRSHNPRAQSTGTMGRSRGRSWRFAEVRLDSVSCDSLAFATPWGRSGLRVPLSRPPGSA
jgi:hypothetical protein